MSRKIGPFFVNVTMPPEDKYGNESVEDRMARVRKYRDLADRLLKFVSDREKGHHAKAASG